MSPKAKQADLSTQSETNASDTAGCAICSTAATGYCFCQIVFANVINAQGVDFGKKIEFDFATLEEA